MLHSFARRLLRVACWHDGSVRNDRSWIRAFRSKLHGARCQRLGNGLHDTCVEAMTVTLATAMHQELRARGDGAHTCTCDASEIARKTMITNIPITCAQTSGVCDHAAITLAAQLALHRGSDLALRAQAAMTVYPQPAMYRQPCARNCDEDRIPICNAATSLP